MDGRWLEIVRACKGRPAQTLLERFKSYWGPRTERGCIEWQGHRLHFEHGQFTVGRKHFGESQAHRLAYMLAKGLKKLPKRKLITHTCDNPPCVAEEHLVLGTHQTNNEDMDRRGRRQRGEDRPAAKLTEKIVVEARKRYAAGEISSVALSREFSVSQSTMHAALTRLTWKYLP